MASQPNVVPMPARDAVRGHAPDGVSTPRRRFLIIHNIQAGTIRRRLFLGVFEALERAGCVVTTQIAADASDMESDRQLVAEAAAGGDYDAVVAAGGDGTVRSVALGLLGTGVPLGVIPVGTGNVMAAELGLRRSPAAVAGCLMRGPAREIRVATANGQPFLLMAGAGFDGDVVGGLNLRLKRVLGRAAYAWPTLSALAGRLSLLRVDVDGTRHEAAWAVVTSAARYGGTFRLSDDSSIFEPGLTTVLFQPRSRLDFLGQLTRLAAGTLAQAPRVAFLPSERTHIEAERPAKVQVDGEPFGTTPLAVRADARTVRLLVPA